MVKSKFQILELDITKSALVLTSSSVPWHQENLLHTWAWCQVLPDELAHISVHLHPFVPYAQSAELKSHWSTSLSSSRPSSLPSGVQAGQAKNSCLESICRNLWLWKLSVPSAGCSKHHSNFLGQKNWPVELIRENQTNPMWSQLIEFHRHSPLYRYIA